MVMLATEQSVYALRGVIYYLNHNSYYDNMGERDGIPANSFTFFTDCSSDYMEAKSIHYYNGETGGI